MNIFGIGLPEMAVIAAIALIVFGPKRLPEMGKTLGRTLKGFQTASREFEEEFRTALRTTPEEEASPSPSPAPAALPLTPSVALTAASESPAAVVAGDAGASAVQPEPVSGEAPIAPPPAA
jgi:sec-independent protein translocase protein TatA